MDKKKRKRDGPDGILDKNLDKKMAVNGLTNCKRHYRGMVHYKTTRAAVITFLWANNVDRVRRDIYVTVRVI